MSKSIGDDTIEFHRHLGQHRDDPIGHPFHRGIVLNVDSVGPQQHVLDGGTRQADIKLVSITSTSTVAGATEHEHEFLMHSPGGRGQHTLQSKHFVAHLVPILVSRLVDYI